MCVGNTKIIRGPFFFHVWSQVKMICANRHYSKTPGVMYLLWNGEIIMYSFVRVARMRPTLLMFVR